MNKKRTEEYRKDPNQEQLLEKLNEALESVERELVTEFSSPDKPTIFVVGAPRSATTLIHQLCAQTDQFGYISNYIARFWMAPYVGALQQKALGILEEARMSYNSDYGRTSGWPEPHQFNYFWKKWLRYDEDHPMNQDVLDAIDRTYFRAEIAALEGVFGQPMVFKSLYCGLQIDFLKEVLPRARFVVCTRDPLYQAQSILGGRKAFFGSYDGWFSLKPPQYHELKERSPYVQVAGQVYHILKEIGKDIAQLPDSEYVLIDQLDLVENPKREVGKILNLAGVESEKALEKIPDGFQNRNEQWLDDEEWANLKAAISEVFEGRSSREVLL